MTAFANYSMGMATVGVQVSEIAKEAVGETGESTVAYGLAINVNDNLSISYGERETDYNNPGAAHVTEDITGVAAAYTMGSIKIAGNINEVDNNNGTADSKDENMEIAISFAF